MSETPENPNTLLEEIRGGAQRTFDAPELCHLLLQILATPDYWDDDGYLIHMQFHRDEVRTIANFMSIGIGAANNAEELPPLGDSQMVIESGKLGVFQGPGTEELVPTNGECAPDSAALGEFMVGNDVAAGFAETAIAVPTNACDNATQSETDN